MDRLAAGITFGWGRKWKLKAAQTGKLKCSIEQDSFINTCICFKHMQCNTVKVGVYITSDATY